MADNFDMSLGSISVSISKGSVYESGGFSMYDAALEDALGREEKSISNESIQKGDTLLDTYTVEADAISGGMGSVWRVHHQSWNIDLAMKRPQPRFFAEGSQRRKENFIKECDAWINLGLHPNIVSCYYVREIGGVPTIFSEWMNNGSLKDRIRDGSLYEGTDAEQIERLLNLAIQFSRGLRYSHENGLIHRDVKPDNLLLTKEWDAKVSDFGLAKARDEALSEEGAAHKGGYTPEYSSSEQAAGLDTDARTDLYSWALSVLEMCCGARKWADGVTAGQNCRTYLEHTRMPVPGTLKELLVQCTDAEPENRPHDFTVVEEALLSIYHTHTGTPYTRAKSKASPDTTDSMNNRALSYLDLGKPDKAEELWRKALMQNREHLFSLFNFSLHQWRNGCINDFEIYQHILHINNKTDDWKRLMLAICLWRQDLAAEKFGATDQQLQKLRPLSTWNIEFDNHQDIAVSPDRCYVLFRNKKKQIEMMDIQQKKTVRVFPAPSKLQALSISLDNNMVLIEGNFPLGKLAQTDMQTRLFHVKKEDPVWIGASEAGKEPVTLSGRAPKNMLSLFGSREEYPITPQKIFGMPEHYVPKEPAYLSPVAPSLQNWVIISRNNEILLQTQPGGDIIARFPIPNDTRSFPDTAYQIYENGKPVPFDFVNECLELPADMKTTDITHNGKRFLLTRGAFLYLYDVQGGNLLYKRELPYTIDQAFFADEQGQIVLINGGVYYTPVGRPFYPGLSVHRMPPQYYDIINGRVLLTQIDPDTEADTQTIYDIPVKSCILRLSNHRILCMPRPEIKEDFVYELSRIVDTDQASLLEQKCSDLYQQATQYMANRNPTEAYLRLKECLHLGGMRLLPSATNLWVQLGKDRKKRSIHSVMRLPDQQPNFSERQVLNEIGSQKMEDFLKTKNSHACCYDAYRGRVVIVTQDRQVIESFTQNYCDIVDTYGLYIYDLCTYRLTNANDNIAVLYGDDSGIIKDEIRLSFTDRDSLRFAGDILNQSIRPYDCDPDASRGTMFVGDGYRARCVRESNMSNTLVITPASGNEFRLNGNHQGEIFAEENEILCCGCIRYQLLWEYE